MNELPDEAKPAIDRLNGKIFELERQANDLRQAVNKICLAFDAAPIYNIVDPAEAAAAAATKTTVVRPDQFFGKPFSTCVREILEERKGRNLGPADPKELYEVLRQGGFAFDSKNDTDSFRAMMISIGKNTATFVRLPTGQIGMQEWYGPRRPRLQTKGSSSAAAAPLSTFPANNPWPMPDKGNLAGDGESVPQKPTEDEL